MNEGLLEQVKSIMENVVYATIATVSAEGEPWNSPVYCGYDERYSIYWGSPVEAQHSLNIEANGLACIVIYDSTVTPGTGKAVYIKASCGRLTDPKDIRTALKIIEKRRGAIPYWSLEDILESGKVGLYKAAPLEVSTNDEFLVDGTIVDQRVVVSI